MGGYPYLGTRWWRTVEAAGILVSVGSTKAVRNVTLGYYKMEMTGTGTVTLQFKNENRGAGASPDIIIIEQISTAGTSFSPEGLMEQGPLGYRLEVAVTGTPTSFRVKAGGWRSVEHQFDGFTGAPDAQGNGQDVFVP